LGRQISVLFALVLFLSFSKERQIDYSFDIPDVESALGTKENPQARMAYEQLQLVSPKTGIIPFEIRKKELAFEKKLLLSPKYLKASNTRKAQNEWDLAGPFNVGGRTRGAGIDPRNDNIIIAAGTTGGIWKTEDAGLSWKRTTPTSTHNGISCLKQDLRPGKQNTWYAGTGEQVGNSARGVDAPFRGNGLLKSTDNGNSWAFLASTTSTNPQIFNSQFQYSWNIAINHAKTDVDEIYLASYGGILRSSDGGDSWEVLLGNKLFDLPEDFDINKSTDPSHTDVIQNSDGHFFASMSSATSTDENYKNGGFYYSADGDTWTKITPPGLAEYHDRTVIGSGKSSPGKVYFLTHTGEEKNELWLYTYTFSNGNLSGNWQDLTANIPSYEVELGDFNSQGGYNMVVSVHPENENLVFLGGTNLYRSTDGFQTANRTKWIGGYHPNGSNSLYPSHHADQHLLLYYPDSPNKVLSCHDGGVSICQNITADSVTYKNINNGYITSMFYTIAQQHDEVTDVITGGLQDNGAFIRESKGINPSWIKLISGDGAYTAIAPNKNFVYLGLQSGLIFRVNLTSTNQLAGFARVDPSDGGTSKNQEYLFINPFMLDPLNGNRMFLLGGDVVWRNHNLAQIPNGSNNKTSLGWEKLKDTRINQGVFTAIDKSQDVVYAAAYMQNPLIVKIESASVDGSEKVTKHTSNLPELGYASCVAADQENPDFLLVTFSNYEIPSIFLSTDGADTFVDVSGNLEEFEDGTGDGPSIRWAEIATITSGNKYYVGTSIGLYSTEILDGSNTIWTKEGANEIGNSVVTMMDYRGLDGRLIAATHGNGTFRAFLENPRAITNETEADFVVKQNYPNPFTNETLITFSLPEDDIVRIDIIDSQGQMVRNLLWGMQYAGANAVTWDGKNSYGTEVRNGVYYYHLSYQGKTKTKRMVYIR
jgi:hypothetical protein